MTVTREMSIGDVLKLDRGTAPVFMQYGMHCLGCPHATAESIEQASAVHGVDVEALVNSLNQFFADKGE